LPQEKKIREKKRGFEQREQEGRLNVRCSRWEKGHKKEKKKKRGRNQSRGNHISCTKGQPGKDKGVKKKREEFPGKRSRGQQKKKKTKLGEKN